ncbi:hypothetical protein [Vibrio coralliilyticus]|uniref:hypothetical protein n=1 Tax=Vibrio coralliilyticus TaxID=190893 RepID=UPI00155FBEFA|nr:hypothetical protein [Vibrio coralliilyticus]NRF63613.1 hypothetical protein [Vibrio coralliilyticus]
MGSTPNSLEFIVLMWKGLTTLGSIATGIAAVAAVAIAAKALSTWKEQFKHQELHKQISSLENTYHGYLYSYDLYREAFAWNKRCSDYNFETSDEYRELADSSTVLGKNFNSNFRKLLREYEKVEPILTHHNITLEPFVDSINLLYEEVLSSFGRKGVSIGYDRSMLNAQRRYALEVTKELRKLKHNL